MKHLLVLAPLLLPLSLAADTTAEALQTDPVHGTKVSSANAPAVDSTRIDRIHSKSEQAMRRLVGKLDSFFISEEYATFSDNDSRVRLRLDADHFENSGWDVSPRIKMQLVMPGLQQRLRLVVNDGEAEESGQPSTEDNNDNDIAFRWVSKTGEHLLLSYDLGIRIRGSGVDEFARVNAGVSFPVAGKWLGQTSNRLYYYVTAGWRNDFSQRFDRPIGNELLFRSRSRIQYYQENSYNPNLEQKFSLFQTLDSKSVLAYEAIWRRQAEEDSVYGDSDLLVEPRDRYDQYALQLRYRRNVGRPWFFVEFWPIVFWPEERDWEISLGARVRIEVNLGSAGQLELDD